MPHYDNDFVESNYGKDGGAAVVGRQSWAGDGTPGSGGNAGWFESDHGEGVRGWSKTQHHGGVVGVNTNGGFGVYGTSDGSGVVGESTTWMGVYGKSTSTTSGAGVMGEAIGSGVIGKSSTWHGVYGETSSTTGGNGVFGENTGLSGSGVAGHGVHVNGGWFDSEQGEGVRGNSKNTNHAGVVGTNPAGGDGGYFESSTAGGSGIQAISHSGAAGVVARNTGQGPALYAKGDSGTAAYFDGNIEMEGIMNVAGDITLKNGDCAEDFSVAREGADVAPGTVMVLADSGFVQNSTTSYDKRVAGVISGAGKYRPGLILDRDDAYMTDRVPVALMGKVYCKVDATTEPVDVGDPLTTSDTEGHAMKASDHERAFGAVIGKALAPLCGGSGLIPVLVALQ
jgi:hypothetical protein